MPQKGQDSLGAFCLQLHSNSQKSALVNLHEEDIERVLNIKAITRGKCQCKKNGMGRWS